MGVHLVMNFSKYFSKLAQTTLVQASLLHLGALSKLAWVSLDHADLQSPALCWRRLETSG